MPNNDPQNTSAASAADAAQLSAGAAEAQPAPVAQAPVSITLDDIKNAAKAAIVAREQELKAEAESALQSIESEGSKLWQWLRDKFRASPLLIIFIIAFTVVWTLNPAKAGLALWGVARIGLFGWLGYWVDRIIFGRLKGLTGINLGTAWKRRSLIVAAALIAGALLP
jgi:hypothetical protein